MSELDVVAIRQREQAIEGTDVDLHQYIPLLRGDVAFLLDQITAQAQQIDALQKQLLRKEPFPSPGALAMARQKKEQAWQLIESAQAQQIEQLEERLRDLDKPEFVRTPREAKKFAKRLKRRAVASPPIDALSQNEDK